MRFPVRRVLLGLAVGAAAGWVGGLLRKPATAPSGSSAEGATRLPQEEFGSPVEDGVAAAAEAEFGTADDVAQEPTAPAAAYDSVTNADPDTATADAAAVTGGDEPAETPPPRKATPRAVKRPPGSRKTKAAAAEATPGASEPAAGPEATATGGTGGTDGSAPGTEGADARGATTGEPETAPTGGSEQAPPADPSAPSTPADDATSATSPTRAPAGEPTRPRRRRATKAVVDDAAAELREGHAAATERLAGAEADATPPPEDPGPAARRRRTSGNG